MSEPALHTTPNSNPDFSELLGKLNASFDSGKTRDLTWRREQLMAVERMMNEREQEFFDALQSDLGKSAMES